MAQLRIGIIGVGGFGRFSLEQYRTIPEARITAIAGTHPEKYARLAQEFDIPFHTVDWRELVASPDVDVVYIATPPSLHVEQAVAAAEAGKHVFLEKPLALNLQEADAILRAASARNVRVGINFVMRYSALYDAVRVMLCEGLLGAPMRFDFENIAGDLPAGHWFWDPARSGGIPVEHGVHFFDIACSLLGTGQVTCACSANRESGATDRWQIGVRYGANVLSSFYHAFVAPSALERTWCVLACERGILRLDGWIPTHLMVDALTDAAQADRLCALVPDLIATPLDAPHEVLANGRAFTVTHKVAGVWSPAPKQEIYAAAVRDAMSDFLAWVRDPAHPVRVTGEDGRDALAMAAAAVSRAQ